MCGRYALFDHNSRSSIERLFSVKAAAEIPQHYNIAPRQPVLIVRMSEAGQRELAAVEWGLVPEWKKEIGDKPLINARIETIMEKPSFRSSIKRKRCLVPFSGWYEWKTLNGKKVPHLVTPTDSNIAAFAGIWSTWHGPGGDFWLETMAIVTAATNARMKSLHHRMPLVVPSSAFSAWLQPHDPLPRGFLEEMDFLGENAFEWRPVSSKVNSVRMAGPDCIAPPEEDPQHSLF